jgi:DNA invertase Pin-like site-specific DNA recombinase
MPKISKDELVKLQKKLKTDAAIGKKYGVTRQSIHQLRKKFKIESSFANNSTRNTRIISLYKKGISVKALTKKFELSIAQVYRVINKAGALKKKRKGKR